MILEAHRMDQSGATRPLHDSPLTVAYVLKMFPRFSETFILNEILELERRGVRIFVFSMKEPNETVRQPGVERVNARQVVIPPFRGMGISQHIVAHVTCLLGAPLRYVRTLTFALGRRSRAARAKFLCAPFIVRTARREGVEHFHAHFASGPARQAKFASMLSSIPYSFTAHAKDLFWNGHMHGKNNKLKKRIRQAAFVVTISDYNRKFIQGLNFKIPRRRITTIYNGLDLSLWRWVRPDGEPGTPSANEPPIVLSVGRLVPKKGFHVLADACRILKGQGVRFRWLIAGDGPDEAHLQNLVSAYGLNERVEFAGAVPLDRLRSEFYPRAAVLVQPSVVSEDGDQDGIPTVILEAQAIGLPVVTTPISGIGEAVVDGETGLMVEADDPGSLAEAIRRILTTPELRCTLSKGGRALIERRFSIKDNAKLLIHLMTVAARDVTRWSDSKLRERVGLDPLNETPEGVTAHGPTRNA